MKLWPEIRFDDDEYADRLARMQDTIGHAGLDALLVSDERTTWYLTGFGADEPIGSTARPRIVVVFADGPATFLVHRSTERCVREMAAPTTEVVLYPELGAPVEEVASLLARRDVRRAGADLGGGLQPRLGSMDVRGVEHATGLALSDGSALLWDVRARKSPAEVDRIRRACAITTDAYDLLFARVRRGMTEAGVARAMRGALGECGAQGGWANCVAGRGQYNRIDGVPREQVIEPGELVFLDAGASVGGYWADFSRAGVLGRPSAHQDGQQQRVRRATQAGVRALRAGRPLADVAATLDEAMAAEGIAFNNRPGRYGHSVGMTVTEPPDVAPGEATVLAPGMVVTIEPATLDEQGIYHCEENVLVTAEGPETLSHADWRLRALG
jgi:Xaa-Pro dipeptidase